jgi:hypothetical protein
MELCEQGEGGREKRLVMAAAELAHIFRTLDLQGWLSGSGLLDVSPESQRTAALSSLMDLLGIAKGDTRSGVFFGGRGVRTEDATVVIPPELRRTVIGALVGTSEEHASDLSQFGEAGAAQFASQVADGMKNVVEQGAEKVAEITVLPPDPTLFVLPVFPYPESA